MASTPTRDLPEEFLAATRKSQEAMIRAIKTWVETVRTVTPKLPSGYVPFADRLPKLPSVTVPFADKLPTAEEVVANGYDFAEHLLHMQRKFAEDLLEVTEPLIPGTGKRAWASATSAGAAEKVADQALRAGKAAATETTKAVTETAKAAEQAVAPTAPNPTIPATPKPTVAAALDAAKAQAADSTTKAAKPAPAKAAPKPPADKPKAAPAAKATPKPATPRRTPKDSGAN